MAIVGQSSYPKNDQRARQDGRPCTVSVPSADLPGRGYYSVPAPVHNFLATSNEKLSLQHISQRHHDVQTLRSAPAINHGISSFWRSNNCRLEQQSTNKVSLLIHSFCTGHGMVSAGPELHLCFTTHKVLFYAWNKKADSRNYSNFCSRGRNWVHHL